MNNDKLINEAIKEATYIISEKKTLNETAQIFGISKKTLYNHFQKLKESKIKNHIDLYNQLQIQLLENEKVGKKIGGSNSKVGRSRTWNEEVARKVAIIIIAENWSLREAAEYFKIPKSTLFEMLNKGLVDEKNTNLLNDLNSHFEKNHRHKKVESDAHLEELIIKYQPLEEEIFKNGKKK